MVYGNNVVSNTELSMMVLESELNNIVLTENVGEKFWEKVKEAIKFIIQKIIEIKNFISTKIKQFIDSITKQASNLKQKVDKIGNDIIDKIKINFSFFKTNNNENFIIKEVSENDKISVQIPIIIYGFKNNTEGIIEKIKSYGFENADFNTVLKEFYKINNIREPEDFVAKKKEVLKGITDLINDVESKDRLINIYDGFINNNSSDGNKAKLILYVSDEYATVTNSLAIKQLLIYKNKCSSVSKELDAFNNNIDRIANDFEKESNHLQDLYNKRFKDNTNVQKMFSEICVYSIKQIREYTNITSEFSKSLASIITKIDKEYINLNKELDKIIAKRLD